MRRFISLALALLMALTILPLNAFAVTTVASGTCGDNLTWLLTSDGTLTISGEGAMADYDTQVTPWSEYILDIHNVEISDGVTSIGSYAFDCFRNMTDISIPDSVTSIGYAAFQFCENLTDITLPDNITVIRGYTFNLCTNLASINIPNSVSVIENRAFQACNQLKNVIIPNSVIDVYSDAFRSCTSLESITFLSNITVIGYNEDTISDTATIYGYSGSTAQAYAQRYGRTFVAIDQIRTGNLNGDNTIDKDDAIYLLYHSLFPETYPITEDCDYNNDGVIDNDDALYLLYHSIFGESVYPLN